MNFLSDFPALRTERLVLRAPDMADAPGILALRSDPGYALHTGIPRYESLEQARDYLRRLRTSLRAGDTVHWTITQGADSATLGGICLWNLLRQAGEAEVGYDLLPAARGRGYASEALAAVLDYAFGALGLTRIVTGDIHPANTKSMAVVERAGFVRGEGGNCYTLTQQDYTARQISIAHSPGRQRQY